MTSRNFFVLITFLLYFCFVSTSYAEPCLLEISSSIENHGQLPLDDTLEKNPLLSKASIPLFFGQVNPCIENTVPTSPNCEQRTCCNRDPPKRLG